MSVARRKSVLNREIMQSSLAAADTTEELKEILTDKVSQYMLSVYLSDERIIKVGSIQQKLGPLLRQRWLVLTDKPRLIIFNGNIFEKKSIDDCPTPDMVRLQKKRGSVASESRKLSGPIQDTISETSTTPSQGTTNIPLTTTTTSTSSEVKPVTRRKSVLQYFSHDSEIQNSPTNPEGSSLGRKNIYIFENN
eukprot:NODE_230_length_12188_cov_0.969890.p7 type:complete len:193 gc:universal NODE_230_length_12188_cov_0.969890:610-32(-)